MSDNINEYRKSTKSEIAIRLKEVYTLICDGKTYDEICRYGSKWNISTRQIDRYISHVTKKVNSWCNVDIENKRKMAIERYNTYIKNLELLTNESAKINEKASVYNAIEKMAKRIDLLNGLEVQKIEHTGTFTNKTEFSIIGVSNNTNTDTEKDINSVSTG